MGCCLDKPGVEQFLVWKVGCQFFQKVVQLLHKVDAGVDQYGHAFLQEHLSRLKFLVQQLECPQLEFLSFAV